MKHTMTKAIKLIGAVAATMCGTQFLLWFIATVNFWLFAGSIVLLGAGLILFHTEETE